MCRQRDGGYAVQRTVLPEDVTEAGRDDRPETVVAQRPDGMFAAGAAAEVLARQQHAGAAQRRAVEDETGIEAPHGVVAGQVAGIEVAPVVEQRRAVAATR